MALQLYKDRLTNLRKKIAHYHGDGILIPHADRFQAECLCAADQHLAWLTGFTGSAGLAIVLQSQAALFVDGRYTLQAHHQVHAEHFSIQPYCLKNVASWLKEHCQPGYVLLYDPWLHTVQQIKNYQKSFSEAAIVLKPCSTNLVKELWSTSDEETIHPFTVHPLKWSGESSEEKIQKIIAFLNQEQADQLVITSPSSIAWLLNIRGQDVPYTPDCRAFGILHQTGALDIFTDLQKVTKDIEIHCGPHVFWRDFSQFPVFLSQAYEKTVIIDPCQASHYIALELQKAKATLLERRDPCLLGRALKNQCEQEGAIAAHQRDGVAVTHFLAWLLELTTHTPVSELEAATYLLQQRQLQPYFQSESFPLISAAADHGAIVHYFPTPETNALIKPNMIYLVDSGGQYYDGTTDITRTVAIGTPTLEQKDRFTRVLKGHIALADIKFPLGTTGHQLDVLARQYLWQIGLDYEHSTGHGVGSYLAVHEGPHQIGKTVNSVPLQPGMIVSNEPGYYKTHEYGIRIENLMLVVPVETQGKHTMLGFKTLTLVPIDQNLIETGLLTPSEKKWLNDYHAYTFEKISPFVTGNVLAWLKQATHPIA